MPVESNLCVAEGRPRRRLARKLVLAFAATLAVFATAAFAVLHNSGSLTSPCTVTYSLTSSGSVWDWTSSATPWSPTPPPSQYPGQTSGDCVSIGSSVQVSLATSTISLGDVTIATTSGGPATTIFVGSGGSITETAGSFNNNGTLEIDTNGVTTFNSATSQSVVGTVTVNGGTLTINEIYGLYGQILMHG